MIAMPCTCTYVSCGPHLMWALRHICFIVLLCVLLSDFHRKSNQDVKKEAAKIVGDIEAYTDTVMTHCKGIADLITKKQPLVA